MLHTVYQLRKELHQYAELSGNEEVTARRIIQFIRQHHNTEIITGIGGFGIAAVYTFSDTGPIVMIRCELDALPIREVNLFPYRSVNSEVSHKCGHDGHMAILAGLALWLKNQSFKKGKIILLFQPSEENGKGAYAVLNDLKFKNIQPDYIFALHNLPGEPLNTAILRNEEFTATVQSVAIYLNGKQAHASEPETGINPAGVISELIHSFEKLNNNNPLVNNFAILTPIYLLMGEKEYGISAGSGELHYTLRTWTEEVMKDLKNNILEITGKICNKYKVSHTFQWFDYFPAVINDHDCLQQIKNSAEVNGITIIQKDHPLKFGEDFGWFSRKYKAGMFGLGAGLSVPALHHDDYDFPDDIIETGIKLFGSIITQILKEESN